MTDITELAQSLKAAAEKATPGPWALARDRKTVVSNQSHPIANLSDAMHRMLADGTTGQDAEFISLANPANVLALVEALEKSQAQSSKWLEGYHKAVSIGARYEERIAELEEAEQKLCAANVTLDARAELAERRLAEMESRTVKLPDGWQFEECEIEGCENGAIFSVGTGSRNIHLCDKCAHEPQNSRLKKSPLSKRLPFKMSAGIKVEAE
ncbi:TPA: ead/Ea22-like family protein [Klebsiella pneumoniae]|nr:ead/Ea22-like family protein [Klebsiella pneumoniae]